MPRSVRDHLLNARFDRAPADWRRGLRLAMAFGWLSIVGRGFVFADEPVVRERNSWAEAHATELILASGEKFAAELVIADEREGSFRDGGDERKVPWAEVVAWGAPAEPIESPWVIFADGGAIAANPLELADERLVVDSELFGEQRFPLRSLAAIVFRAPFDPQDLDALFDRLSPVGGENGLTTPDREGPERSVGDRLSLENGDELSGAVVSLDGKSVTFQVADADEPVKVALEKVVTLSFDWGLARPDGAQEGAWLGFSDGGRVLARSWSVSADEVTLAWAAADVTGVTERNRLCYARPQGGKVAYLSDMPIVAYKHLPFLDTAWSYRQDRCATGTRLRAGGRLYDKGIGMHSVSRLSFRLDGKWRRFDADLAIDDDAEGRGSVVFRVFLDGQQKFQSAVVRGGDRPIPCSLDVEGAKQISLIVDFADRGDELDHADWLDARLSP